MQPSRVRFSSRTQSLFGNLKNKTGLPANALARHGLCLSLRDKTIPNADMYDENGMDISLHVLFGKYSAAFDVIMQQRLLDDNLDYDKYYYRMLRAHLNRGAGMLFPRIESIDEFIKLVVVK